MFFFRKKSGLLSGLRQKQPGFCFSAAAVSDIGCLRADNQDNYLLDRYRKAQSDPFSEATVTVTDRLGQWHFAGVFDGMGGGELGELASSAAAEIFLNTLSGLAPDASRQSADLAMRSAFLEANNAVVALQQAHNVLGTTGTVCCMDGEVMKLYHLGDSRAYLFREGCLFRLTRDQTLAQMKLDVGCFREDAPEAEADRHRLTDYIGRDRTRERLQPVESEWIPLEQGDRVLLCSDGLYDMCSDEEIGKIMDGDTKPEKQAKLLADTARRNGGRDNITCIVAACLR